MAAVRLTRLSRRRPSSVVGAPTLRTVPSTVRFRVTCIAAGFGPESGQLAGEVEKKRMVAAALTNSAPAVPTQTSERGGLATLLVFLRGIILVKLKIVMRRRPWGLIIQSLVEKVIMDSRFFTMLGVVGTLLGSVLCFLEIFIVGTAMLTIGTGLHVMFIRSRAAKGNGLPVPPSNFFGIFYLKEIPSWAGMKSISQAKSKFGHALTLLLQVAVLEKFKSISLVTGLDLACFAAAMFVSSAGLFILSQISNGRKA